MKIYQIGEFGLIDKFIERLGGKNRSLTVDIGDDAAVFGVAGGTCLVVTKDIFIERVHFNREWSSFYHIGFKAMTANISDLAAMGGAKPLYAVVGLALPVDISVNNVDNLYNGFAAAGGKHRISIIGGDTILSKKDIVISITLIGSINKKNIITRSGAREGDFICVTGTFGDSAAGLKILKSGDSRARYGQLVHAYLAPRARLDESSRLASTGVVTSMIDSSDGLAASVNILAASSGLGAEVELDKIPLSGAFKKWAVGFKKFPWETVLNGGEEFELVFTVPQSKSGAVLKKKGISVVGRMRKKSGVEYYLNGKKTDYKFGGYRNF